MCTWNRFATGWIGIIFENKLFLVKCLFKINTNSSEPAHFFLSPLSNHLDMVQDQQSMKIVINHQKPEIKTVWQAANHSQIFPPGPHCSLCLLPPSYLLFSDTIFFLHVAPQMLGKRRQTRLVVAPRHSLTSFSSREATLKLLKALVCQAERLDVTIHSSWQETGECGRVFFFPPPLHFFLLLSRLLLRPLFRARSHWDRFFFWCRVMQRPFKGEIRPFVKGNPGRRRQKL